MKHNDLALIKSMNSETRRAYLAKNLDKLMPRYAPHYEGGWWYQMAGHYPSEGWDEAPPNKRTGHSGTWRGNCIECWQAKLAEWFR